MVVRLISPLKVESARLASLVQVEVDRRNYSRAAAIATTLGVQTAFEFCDICVPCLLENAIERVEDYVEPHPELQIQLVQFLDGITTNNAAQLSALWRSYPWIQTKSPRLSGKSLGKLIERLLKKFELDPKMAPLHTKTRTFLAFRYQVLTKNEPTTRLENWRDLVGEFVGKDLELAYTLVNLLTNGRSIDPDFKEAQFWANKLDLDRRRLPYGIDDDFEDPLSGNGDDADENWDEDQNGGKFYALRLPRERILMIDTQPAFRDFLAVLAEETVSGYDSETLPMTSDGVALMQVAFPDQVFLLDANALSGKLSHEDWTGFVQGYFNNPNLLKLGFGLAPDLKNMERFHPAFANLRQTAKRVLDLDPLHRQLFLASNQVLIASYTSDNRGLSGFVESIFGLPLDKRDQISHWDKRPLSESQTIYAALDAFVLLDLYNQILALSEVRGQKDHVYKVIETTIKFGNKLEKNEKKLNSAEEKAMRKEMANLRLSQPVQPLNKEPISVRDIRIACDGMLQGLCKKLRLHGIDTRTIENFESTERLGEIAQEEKRMILTRGVKSFVKLKKFVPPGFILIIQDDLLDHQVEEVLHYFNIRMSPDDFFS
ncbi:exonuclease mut-7 homolog isoform X2 [Tigriopus californicus]|nr:exonuclease mut-7 homolog isoform X2 [Tigriopus californicus]